MYLTSLTPATSKNLYSNDLFKNFFDVAEISKNNKYVKEKDGVFSLKFNVAGYEKEEVNISFAPKEAHKQNRLVTVDAHNDEFGSQKYTSYIHSNADEKTVKANLKNGILTISYCLEKIKNPLSSLKIEVQ